MMTMSDRLREARQNSGFSSASAAAKAHGWRVSTYIAHENGQNDYNPERAEIYAKAFKSTAEWLLFGKEIPTAGIDAQLRTLPADEARKLIEKFTAMIEGVKVVGKIR
jgi:DNA-binding XRE family transcriptional regulator